MMAFRPRGVARWAVAAATVLRVIAVQQHVAITGKRYTDRIVISYDWGQIYDTNNDTAGAVASQPAEHAAVTVIPVDPLETGAVKINLVQCRGTAIDPVQVSYQPLHAAVRRMLEQVPVQRPVMVPFVPLRDFVPHERQLLPGCANITA